MGNLQEILTKLSKPVESVKWKVQSSNERYAICVPYIDSRDAQQRLDETCIWQDRYTEHAGRIYCEIGIRVGDEWLWRSDVGTGGGIEKEKSEASDAFKRAAVKWGIGRFLYDMEPRIFNQTGKHGKNFVPMVEDRYGKALLLKTGSMLTDYINKERGGKTKLEQVLSKELEGIKTVQDLQEFNRNLKPIFGKKAQALNG